MKIQPIVTATLIAVLFTGCAGTSPTRLVGNTIGAAGGALLGSTLGKHNPFATAAGAGAGLLLSESLQAGSTHAADKSYAAGYEKGRSDSAKQQYHTLIDQQRQPATTAATLGGGGGAMAAAGGLAGGAVAGGAALAGSSMSGSPYSPGGGLLSSLASQRRPKPPAKDDLSGDEAVRELLAKSRN